MTTADYFAPGDWGAICQACGRKVKASELRKRWDGFYVCEREYEPRQPQDFVRAVPDNQAPPFTSPMPDDQFVGVCSLSGGTGVAGYSEAGCWVAGRPLPPGFDPSVSQ